MTNGLSVRDLTVSAKAGHTILSEVSFDLVAGERLGIVGASGSGKSTIANALLGLLPANFNVDSGSVTVAGANAWVADEMRKVRGRRIGLIHQDPVGALNPVRTVGAHFQEALRVHDPKLSKAQIRERAHAELERVWLPAGTNVLNKYAFELSGGMCQRVLIALTMALDPTFVIADEPTSFLDTLVQADIIELLRERVSEAGSGLVLISHDFGVINALSESIIVLSDGCIVERGSCAEVLAKPEHPVTQDLLHALPTLVREGRIAETPALKPWAEEPVVTTKNLTKRFSSVSRRAPRVTAVDNVSIALHKKRITGLVGASGCGKSTLARVLCGLEKVDGGGVQLTNAAPGKHRRHHVRALRGRVQLVFQDAAGSLHPHLTVGESVVEPLVSQGLLPIRSRRSTAASLLDSVGLSRELLDRLPHQLSGGQAQRVSIARAISTKPDLLIFDESLSGLDVLARSYMLDTIRSLRDRDNLAMLFISHDFGLVSEICDEVHVMNHGSIIESCDVQDLAKMSNGFSRELLAAVPTVKTR